MLGSIPALELVVSNTTPLIILAGVSQLDLLPLLYGDIWIPEHVRAEYRAGLKPGEPDPDSLPWLRVQNTVPDPSLLAQLDAGEAAAISLAVALQASLILLDERQARKVAHDSGLRVAGSLGVLLLAKQRGHIPLVAPIIDQMIAQGRYIGPQLRASMVAQAGE